MYLGLVNKEFFCIKTHIMDGFDLYKAWSVKLFKFSCPEIHDIPAL